MLEVLRRPVESTLGAAVGVEHDTGDVTAAGPSGFAESVTDQLGTHMGRHRQSQDASRRQVLDEAEIQEPFPGVDIGDVATPGHIRSVGGEISLDQVRDPMLPVRDGRGAMLLRGVSDNVVDPHQALDSFVVHHPPPFTEFDGHSRRPVGAIRVVPDVFDLFDQPPLIELRDGGDTVTMAFPVVIRRTGHPSNVADSLYEEPFSLLLVDKAVEHHSFDSFTQKATARFKSSRSIRR